MKRNAIQSETSKHDLVDFSVCRGIEANCRFSLINEPKLFQNIKQVVLSSKFIKQLRKTDATTSQAHRRLRIGIAGCPNACSLPQIKTLGLIVRRKPSRFLPGCSGCGTCSTSCKETAIKIHENNVSWDPQRCVGCGLCLNTCSSELIEASELSVELLVGGRMGRHPRFAQLVADIPIEAVSSVMEQLLNSPMLPNNVHDWSYEKIQEAFDGIKYKRDNE